MKLKKFESQHGTPQSNMMPDGLSNFGRHELFIPLCKETLIKKHKSSVSEKKGKPVSTVIGAIIPCTCLFLL